MAVLIDIETTKMRALPRLMQIMRVLAKHKFLGALFGRGYWPAPTAVREALEELGVVFLKFGQVLAMRRDLLPTAYTRELEQLHDQLPAMTFAAVRAKVESELGAPLTALFSSFTEAPIGAATLVWLNWQEADPGTGDYHRACRRRDPTWRVRCCNHAGNTHAGSFRE